MPVRYRQQTCSSFSPYATSVSTRTRQVYKVYADNGIASVCWLAFAHVCF